MMTTISLGSGEATVSSHQGGYIDWPARTAWSELAVRVALCVTLAVCMH